MSKIKILQREAPVLRKTAIEVSVKEIPGKKIQDIIRKMKIAVLQEEDGVAIAAPQIGYSYRIFVVSGRALSLLNKDKSKDQGENLEFLDMVFINPEIIKLSKKKKPMEEGCLSVRWLYGQVKRSEQVVVRAYDENGKKFERGASGLMAQIFQHEIDHLNGILFIDKATDLEDLPPKNHKSEENE